MKTKNGSSRLVFRIAGLALPIWIGQLAAIANPVLDTAMVSRYSVTDLGALAVGASVYVSVYVALNGVMQSLAPTFGQLFGAGRFIEMGKQAKQGVWLAVFLSLAGSLLLCFPQPLLAIAKASPAMTEKATLYLRILAFSLPASLNFLVYNTLNNAMARPKMVMAIQVGGLFLKIPLNTLFIFGGLGIPALGGPGCAVATFIIGWLETHHWLADSPLQPLLSNARAVRYRTGHAGLAFPESPVKPRHSRRTQLLHRSDFIHLHGTFHFPIGG